MWYLILILRHTHVSSLGLGTMGFGYPAAVGAKVARPDKEVIDIDGMVHF